MKKQILTIVAVSLFSLTLIHCGGGGGGGGQKQGQNNNTQTGSNTGSGGQQNTGNQNNNSLDAPEQFAIVNTVPRNNRRHNVGQRVRIEFNEIIDANTVRLNSSRQDLDTVRLIDNETNERIPVQNIITANVLELIPISGFKAGHRYTLWISGEVSSISTVNYELGQSENIQFTAQGDSTQVRYFSMCYGSHAATEFYEYSVSRRSDMSNPIRERVRIPMQEVLQLDLIESDCKDVDGRTIPRHHVRLNNANQFYGSEHFISVRAHVMRNARVSYGSGPGEPIRDNSNRFSSWSPSLGFTIGE
jgi:hypothetical protein